MEKKILIAVIVGGVVLLALVCLLIGALSGQMPWDKSKEYEYNPTEQTTEPAEETTETTEATEDTTAPTEEATVPPTTQATLPAEDKVDVEIEVQLPTTAPTQPTDPTTGTEATTPTTKPSESTQPTEKDTNQVEDPENEQIAGGFWDPGFFNPNN